MSNAIGRWKCEPVAFVTALVNPETKRPFELYPAQVRFLREALVPLSDGHLRFSEMLLGQPKKVGQDDTGRTHRDLRHRGVRRSARRGLLYRERFRSGAGQSDQGNRRDDSSEPAVARRGEDSGQPDRVPVDGLDDSGDCE